MFISPSLPFSWTTLSWPHKLVDQVEATEAQLEQDEQKFQKKLLDDQTQLDDKLDTIQVGDINSVYACDINPRLGL